MSTFSTSSRQKRLKTRSFLHFWLRNVLRATTACTFSTLFRHLNLQKWSEHGVFCTFWLRNVLRATTACTFSTSELPKVVRACGALYILTSKCASRHNGVHFRHLNFQKWSEHGVLCTFWLPNVLRATTACTFDISTSKSGPSMVCFVHFDFQMCFAPQRRALFRHLNFQKWSEHGVFCTFWLPNVLRATPGVFCTFWLPNVLRRALFRHLNFQKWSEHGVFCTFWLPNVLRATTAWTFSSLIWPAGSAPAALATLRSPKSLEKHSVSRLSYLFAHLHLLSSDLVSSDSSHLCFSTVHIVGSFTSKLPSIYLTSRTIDMDILTSFEKPAVFSPPAVNFPGVFTWKPSLRARQRWGPWQQNRHLPWMESGVLQLLLDDIWWLISFYTDIIGKKKCFYPN